MQAIKVIFTIDSFIGADCEKLITAIFAQSDMQRHLVYKLTNYCNKYNAKKADKNKLNFKGLADFAKSLDSTNVDLFNQFFK